MEKLGMFKQIFPELKFNTKFINTNDYIVQIANLLRKNHSTTVHTKLKQAKYINQEIKDIRQLLVMSELSEKALADNIYQIKIEQQHTKLKPQQVKEWASIAGKKVMKVWNFKLSVSAKDAVDKGLKGKDIGDYIKKRETELFK